MSFNGDAPHAEQDLFNPEPIEAPLETEVGRDLYDGMEPMTWADRQMGWALAIYLDCIAEILEEVAVLVRTDAFGNDGWSAFADPQRCPPKFLYTLAQWAGVRYPRRFREQELRNYIGPYAPGIWRGTKRALYEVIRRYLLPGGSIYFEERAVTPTHPNGDPYTIRIFTYSYSTVNEPAIRTELRNNLPAGLILEYEVRVGQTYGMLRDRVGSYQEMKDTWATYDDAKHEQPI